MTGFDWAPEIAPISAGLDPGRFHSGTEMNVSEDMIYAALEELTKNNTASIQSATEYLLAAMNDGNSLNIFFSMIGKSYLDSVADHSPLHE